MDDNHDFHNSDTTNDSPWSRDMAAEEAEGEAGKNIYEKIKMGILEASGELE